MTQDYGNTHGQKQERQVVQELIDSGYDVSPPTKYEDKHLDIDAWIGNLPVSIKSPTPKSINHFGRIVLEYEVQFPDGSWHDSWFKTGQSHAYLFLLNKSVWFADKQAMQVFMDAYQDDQDAIVWKNLTRKTQLQQMEKGHPHINAKNANVKIKRLVDDGVMIYSGELEGGRLWIPAYSQKNITVQRTKKGT